MTDDRFAEAFTEWHRRAAASDEGFLAFDPAEPSEEYGEDCAEYFRELLAVVAQ